MKYEYLSNLPLEQARSNYLDALRAEGLTGSEECVPVMQALHRVTAKAVYAKLCAPHYNASAMDGIALEAAKTFGASETTPVSLSEDDFVSVDTGDPIPDGYDAVVMIEEVIADEKGIKLYSPAVPWQYIRQIGEDICAGDMILPSYTMISPAALGAMLAGGISEITVMRRPVIGIIPTGDELAPPSDHPSPGTVMEFNSAIFSGMLTQWGAKPKVYPIIRDDVEALSRGVEAALSECDGVLVGAGTSAGRDDYTTTVLKTLGHVYCHGIAIKPGKPAVLASVAGKPVIGMPGYPVSSIIILEEIVKPMIYRLLNQAPEPAPRIQAKLSKRLVSSLKYREFVRVRLAGGRKELSAVPLNRGAGVVTSFVKADGIMEIPQDCEGYEAGDPVSVRLLRSRFSIENTLSIVGSHDPLIDEAADLLRRENCVLSISSTHVGSMGGVMAIKRGEATIAGIHLLDPDTGIYNRSYVKHYFPAGDAMLLRGVGRVQGLIVAKGNPLGIHRFEDIVGLRYVNRQGGSGTRLLCDHLVKEVGLDSAQINGYTREEFTHTAVAAQIAGGTADAGLGIYSAAKLYDLDFIPLCNESYDLLLKTENIKQPLVEQFLIILQSEAFKQRLEAMGGYTIEEPGTPIAL